MKKIISSKKSLLKIAVASVFMFAMAFSLSSSLVIEENADQAVAVDLVGLTSQTAHGRF